MLLGKREKRVLIVLVLAGLVAAYFLLGLDRYLSFSYLKSSRERFQDLYTAHPVLVLGGYFLGYVLVTALNLPGALVMTLAGGALFGFWTGTVTVSFASSLGALLACGLSRYLFRGWVSKRLGDRWRRINDGVEREGAFYLFTLRLIPLVPFFVINLGMGLTRMRLWTFYWVSQLGMLPGTVVYVNAGKELGRIDRPGEILSWQVIASFALIGVFPLAAKKVVAWYRRRKGLKELPRPESDNSRTQE
jgi:uncharacterized membrane protein YdjX (TVP38/TMEM64 family)